MMHTVKADSARRPRAVPLAFALAASPLLLASGQALAGKPLPVVSAQGGDCDPSIAGRAERHVAWFELGSNRGRWIFVDAQSKVGDAAWSSYLPDTPARTETDLFVMRHEGVEPGERSSFKLRVMDRKGRPLTEFTEVLDVDC